MTVIDLCDIGHGSRVRHSLDVITANHRVWCKGWGIFVKKVNGFWSNSPSSSTISAFPGISTACSVRIHSQLDKYKNKPTIASMSL